MNYYPLIDEYLDTEKSGLSANSKADLKRAIIQAVDFMTQHESSFPSAEFWSAYKEELSAKYQTATIERKYLPPARSFFDWTAKRSSTVAEAHNSPSTVEVIPSPAEPIPPQTEASRPGRKPKGNEPRDKKITIYLTASLLEAAQDLARIDGMRFPDYLFGLIEQDAHNRQAKLEALRALRM